MELGVGIRARIVARSLTTLARALTTLARALTLRYAPQGVTLVHPVVDQLPVLGHVLLGVRIGVRVRARKVRVRATTLFWPELWPE